MEFYHQPNDGVICVVFTHQYDMWVCWKMVILPIHGSLMGKMLEFSGYIIILFKTKFINAWIYDDL